MASFVKYEQFALDICSEVHNLNGTTDTLKAALTNTAPTVGTDATLADITQIAAGNGYNAGGEDTQNSGSKSGGTMTVVGTDITWTASGGAIATFRYAVLYNSSGSDALIGYWDHGSAVNLAATAAFKLDFGASMFTVT